MFARLEWATLDWLDVLSPSEEVRDAIIRGAYAFCQRLADSGSIDPAHAAAELLSSLESPWIRLTLEGDPPQPLPPDVDPTSMWIYAVTLPANIDTHVAFLRSAWEGAIAYARDGEPAPAQAIADRIREEIHTRRAD